jgi:Domain of unknown function (DUF1963)
MEQDVDRRSFFRSLLRESLGAIQDVRETVEQRAKFDRRQTSPARRLERPGPVTYVADLQDLRALAHQANFEARCADLERLARMSLRLTEARAPSAHAVHPTGTHWGGPPDLPRAVSWPVHEGAPLTFLAQFDLAEVCLVLPHAPLPQHGLLSFFVEAGQVVSLGHVGCRVLFLDQDQVERDMSPREGPSFPERLVELSAELTLPNAWSLGVEDLRLNGEEAEAWEHVRAELALLQGVQIEELVSHVDRLLGHPEELGAEMELDVEPASVPAGDHELSSRNGTELVGRARRWEVLLQASIDRSLGVAAQPQLDRLYFWISTDALPMLRLDAVRALVR